MTTKSKKVLTLVEGRRSKTNIPSHTVDDIRDAVERREGWDFSLVKILDDTKVAMCDFDGVFSDYIIWRDFAPEMETVNAARAMEWIDKQGNAVVMNGHYVGGRLYNSDKFFQAGLFGIDDELKFNTPLAHLIKSKDDIKKLVAEKKLSYPVVVKDRFGTTGQGIVLIANAEHLERVKLPVARLMVMPYIYGDFEWRVFVIGGCAVGVMKKDVENLENPGDFELRSAGFNRAKEEDPAVLEKINHIACRMAAVCGLEYTGCDIIRGKVDGNYYALETNNTAGWQNQFFETTGVNMADKMMDWFDDMAVLKEKGFYEGVKTFTMNRINYLPSPIREKFEKILAFEADVDEASGNDIEAMLANKYREIKAGGDVATAKALLDEVERTPLCWAGNFIGSSIHGRGGIFEEQCIPTAYYLAIREKYDKIQGTN